MSRTKLPITVLDQSTGSPLSGVSVSINVRAGGLTTVYAAEVGTATVANPQTTDALGRISGWVDSGRYDQVVNDPSSRIQSYTEPYDSVPYLDAAMPTGAMIMVAGSAAPTGYQICDGSDAASTALDTYLKASGSPHGTNGVTGLAKVPDLRGRGPLGVGTATGAAGATAHTLGQTGGEETHTLSTNEMPSHGHGYSKYGRNVDSVTSGSFALGTVPGSEIGATTATQGNGASHNNLAPYVGLNFVIKL